MRVASFITTFNRPGRLLEAITATFEQSRPPHHLLVVDNGDPEKSAALLSRFRDLPIAHHAFGDNLGPAGAAAYALERLSREGYDWIAWGDDDTPPRTKDTFRRLIAIAEAAEADVGGVGAVGAHFDWQRGVLVRLPDEALHGVVEVDSIGSGLQLITRRELVETVGLPDARLFFGFYDPEYCLRIRRAGYRLLVDGDLMHEYRRLAGRLQLEARRSVLPRHGRSSLWRRYYVTRNYIFMMRETFGRPGLARREAAQALFRCMTSWGRGPWYGLRFTRHQLLAIFDGYRGRLGRTVLPQVKRYASEGGGAVTGGTARSGGRAEW